MRTAAEILSEVMDCITNAGEPVTVIFSTGEREPAIHEDLMTEAFAVLDQESER